MGESTRATNVYRLTPKTSGADAAPVGVDPDPLDSGSASENTTSFAPEPSSVEALTRFLARAIHPDPDEEEMAVAWVCAKALTDPASEWRAAREDATHD